MSGDQNTSSAKKPENGVISPPRKLPQSQIWHDFTSGKSYFIDQNRGTQDRSDCHGNVIRAFDPNLTGKYDYDGRAELQKGLPVNFGGVELPKSLGSPLSRIYSPENFNFEGYTQFPQPVSSPYNNEKLRLTKDRVMKMRSREAIDAMKTYRESFGSKWNQKLIENILDDPNFSQNNVGVSHLTAPYNYSKQPEAKTLIKNGKEFMMNGIEKFKQKYANKTSIIGSPEQEGGGPSGHQESSQSLKNTRIKDIAEVKLDTFGKTMADNFAGFKKHGRAMNQTHFNRLAITQVTTPVVKRTRESSKTLEPMAATQSTDAKIVPPPGGRRNNDSQMSNQGWKPTMTTQEIMTMKNLFQDYKGGAEDSPYEDKRNGASHLNFNAIKTQRIGEMTLRAKDPRMSLSIDPGTGLVGKVPGYGNIKNYHKDRVQSFFSPVPRKQKEEDLPKTGIDWSKITDPRQSIRIADAINPQQIMEDEFSELELLGGTTKSGGAMLYKLQADRVVQEQIKITKKVDDRLRTKGRFPAEIKTSAQHWITDKDWQLKANPIAAESVATRDDLDKKILEKRRAGRVLKNQALEAQFKIQVKQPSKI